MFINVVCYTDYSFQLCGSTKQVEEKGQQWGLTADNTATTLTSGYNNNSSNSNNDNHVELQNQGTRLW